MPGACQDGPEFTTSVMSSLASKCSGGTFKAKSCEAEQDLPIDCSSINFGLSLHFRPFRRESTSNFKIEQSGIGNAGQVNTEGIKRMLCSQHRK